MVKNYDNSYWFHFIYTSVWNWPVINTIFYMFVCGLKRNENLISLTVKSFIGKAHGKKWTTKKSVVFLIVCLLKPLHNVLNIILQTQNDVYGSTRIKKNWWLTFKTHTKRCVSNQFEVDKIRFHRTEWEIICVCLFKYKTNNEVKKMNSTSVFIKRTKIETVGLQFIIIVSVP